MVKPKRRSQKKSSSRKKNSRKNDTRASPGRVKEPQDMNLTDLQYLARSRGIPFGGLNKSQLLRKLNNYY